MDINLSLKQHQKLSQSQIQSLGILSFDTIELNQFLREEYLENPLLDYTERVPNIAKAEAIKSYANIFSSSDTSGTQKNAEYSVKEYLMNQLDLHRYSSYEQNLMQYLIDCLDDNGFFRFSPEEIAEHTKADVSTIRYCLEQLRALEPAGIFACDLKDCLISQLDPTAEGYEILVELIRHHLDHIAAGKISTISRTLHLSTAEVRKHIDRICLLNPRPLSGFASGREDYIIPDILFKREEDQWTITLNDGWTANYHLNDYYMKMIETTDDPELLSYFEGKLAHIQFIFSCIEQRRNTILSIAREILNRQEPFFRCGGSLAPMTMSSVSETLGIHASTFSRAIRGKYIQYPGGTVLMKDLFHTGVALSSGDETLSPERIKDFIRECIDNEDKKKPYSDQAIVKLLSANDISLSRRAVTKYRQELGIGSSVDRKEQDA